LILDQLGYKNVEKTEAFIEWLLRGCSEISMSEFLEKVGNDNHQRSPIKNVALINRIKQKSQ
jgi:hypothetical protein